jgi:four helix bundle protein
MARITSHRELIIWQKALTLAEQVYMIVQYLPRHERYGLCSQMTRAAVSVAANIAEGYYRSTREYLHFLSIARGSLMELETLITITIRIGHLQANQAQLVMDLITELSKMLVALRLRLGG